MIKRFFILAFYILIISCSKRDSEDLLTKGVWILDNGLFSTIKETVEFYSDNTYFIESKVSITRFNDYISGTLTGDWTRQDNNIIFLNSIVNLPVDTNSISVIPTTSGTPIGSFLGYIVNGIYQNDSSLIDNSGSIHFNDLYNSDIFVDENSNQRFWTIIKLTSDSLIVDSDEEILRYYNE